jgi:methyl coenzyme M reductase gamma subunit
MTGYNAGGVIIIGDEVVKKVEDNIDYVNQAMVGELKRIIAVYRKDESDITADNQAFFFNCVMQIVYVSTPT